MSAPNASGSTTAKAGLSRADLESFLIGFVVEQTGYPAEMVELDVDLEADLGIDSIKKAQLFGELAEQFGIQPPVDAGDIALDDFPTLGHVVNFLEQAMAADSHPAVGGNVIAPTPVVASSPVSDTVTLSPAMSSANRSAVQPAAVQPAVSQPAVSQPAVSQPAVSQPAVNATDLETFLVNFVVDQTGYPAEMVELDADLEADLGIDSIKKAQLFGELAEQFGIQPPDDAGEFSLDDFPTLRHVAKFLQNATAHATSAPATSVVLSAETTVTAPMHNVSSVSGLAASGSTSDADLETFLINFVVEQTGYPTEMVELDVDLEADLGIDSIKKAQLFGELAECFEIQMAEDLSLDDFPTLGHVRDFLRNVPRKVTV